MRTEQTMMRIFEDLETIGHKIIDKVAKVAVSLAKAIVTLLCLGASLSYKAGQKVGEIFYRHKASSKGAEVVANDLVVQQDRQNTCEHTSETEAQDDAVNATNSETIVQIVQTLNILKPIHNNSIESFITDNLRHDLESNFLEAISYKLPRNKRVKSRTHIRHNEIGILKEYYPIAENSGILT